MTPFAQLLRLAGKIPKAEPQQKSGRLRDRDPEAYRKMMKEVMRKRRAEGKA